MPSSLTRLASATVRRTPPKLLTFAAGLVHRRFEVELAHLNPNMS